SERRRSVGRAPHGTDQAHFLAALVEGPKHEQDGIDDAPGDVAADRRHHDLVAIERIAPGEQARTHGDGQHHDQAEQDLAQAFGRIEKAADQGFRRRRVHVAPLVLLYYKGPSSISARGCDSRTPAASGGATTWIEPADDW